MTYIEKLLKEAVQFKWFFVVGGIMNAGCIVVDLTIGSRWMAPINFLVVLLCAWRFKVNRADAIRLKALIQRYKEST